MERLAQAVRVVKAMEKKDTSCRGSAQDFRLDDDVYLLTERNSLGQFTKVDSLDGGLSIRRGSEGRIVGLSSDGGTAVQVEFFEQGTGLFDSRELAKTEGVELDQENLARVIEPLQQLQRDLNYEDLEVSIIAIMGKFRHGKSFLLNLLAQYFEWLELEWLQQTGVNDQGSLVSLGGDGSSRDVYYCGQKEMAAVGHSGEEAQEDPERHVGLCAPPPRGSQCASCRRYQEQSGVPATCRASPGGEAGWWSSDQPIQQSFKVQRQAETCTKGIEIFPRPFLLRRAGKQTAVLLMDSQGAFDGVINERQSQTVLALTTVLASHAIYNFKGNIGEENIKHTMDVANFVKTALRMTSGNDPESRPLGCLSFLLRDFDYPYPDGRRDEEVPWDERLARAAEDLNRFQEASVLGDSFRNVRLSWLCHPGEQVEQGRAAELKMGSVRQLFMQQLDEFVWNSFESSSSGFPFPSRSVFDNAPLTVNNLAAYLENLRRVLFDCDLKLAPPRWLATQLIQQIMDEFKAYLDERVLVSLPAIQLKATGGCGGYYASDLDDFYSITKLVQLQDRVISTSERCPGSPSVGTVSGNAITLLGGVGSLVGDEIHWSSGETPGCLARCGPALPPQVWYRQALTKEQVTAAEVELQDLSRSITVAEAELVRFRQEGDSKLAELADSFRERLAHMLQALQAESQGLQQDLRRSLAEALDTKLLDARAAVAQKEAEVSRQRTELAGQRERIAVLEAKMAKAEVRHLKGGVVEPKPQAPRNAWAVTGPLAWLFEPCTSGGWLQRQEGGGGTVAGVGMRQRSEVGVS
mmetsp:Transcript_10803/g.30458  ORF Transcript_10803/g.30458 Transcript_10803/m.30458 type:complete len:806 (+) Transcript_10803:163-2580(+)